MVEIERVLLPEVGFVRESQIIGRGSRSPGVLPISRSSWWAGIRAGRYPKPVRLSERIVAWRAEDIRRLIEELGAQGAAQPTTGVKLTASRKAKRASVRAPEGS